MRVYTADSDRDASIAGPIKARARINASRRSGGQLWGLRDLASDCDDHDAATGRMARFAQCLTGFRLPPHLTDWDSVANHVIAIRYPDHVPETAHA